uniref:Peroxisomal biogenesis factor 3 n=1 Tax=Syphacia muris TaxID=451379 RepID=A0A0N5AKF7_9BILA
MQSVWKLIKQNRGKIVVGGLAVGAVYLIHNALSRMNTEHLLLLNFLYILNIHHFQARREYIFDTNHRSCDDSLIKFLKFLKDRLEREFNVDLLVEQLRTSSLSNEQRKNLWINVTSFSRIFALAYAMSLVTLSVKTQVSILASEICLHNEGVVKETWYSADFI